ncbi:hypothetical protein DFH06DRAFT_1117948 [Mycena polygramma]|nr:hypothetical protein DFH06DRAFT_1117948 [Mycena polygramma]
MFIATRDREFLSAWFWWTTLSFNLGPFSQSRRGLLERYGRIGKSASQVKRCFLVDRDASIRAVLVASEINGQRNGAQRSLKITVTSQRSVPVRRRQKQERWSSRSVANDVTRRAMGRGWVMIAAVIASDVARDVRATTVIDYDPVPVVGGPVAYASESSDAQFKLKQGADRRPGSGLEQKLRRCWKSMEAGKVFPLRRLVINGVGQHVTISVPSADRTEARLGLYVQFHDNDQCHRRRYARSRELTLARLFGIYKTLGRTLSTLRSGQ